MNTFRATSLLSILLGSAIPLFSQVSLVKDINKGINELTPSYSHGEVLYACGDHVFFNARNEKGNELWRTDGTSNGTLMIKDTYKGPESGYSGKVGCLNSKFYFMARDPENGAEVWVTDGTTENTKPVTDFSAGMGDYDLAFATIMNNEMYFYKDSDKNGLTEIWKSNGVIGVSDSLLQLSIGPGVGNFVNATMNSNTHLFFSVYKFNTATVEELWVTDNSKPAVKLLDGAFLGGFYNLGNKVLFSYVDAVTKHNELWISDGTLNGTQRVKDFGLGGSLQGFASFKNEVVFLAGGTPYITDGTTAGTRVMAQISAQAYTIVDDVFYGFNKNYSTEKSLIFKTDGAVANQIEFTNSGSMFGQIPVLGDKLFFPYENGPAGSEPGFTDFTLQQGITLLKDIYPGLQTSSPRSWQVHKGKLYIIADDGIHGSEIWVSDGTTQGTQLLKDVASVTGSFEPRANVLHNSNGKLLYLASHTLPGSGTFDSLYLTNGSTIQRVSGSNFKASGSFYIGKIKDDLIYQTSGNLYRAQANGQVWTVGPLTNHKGAMGMWDSYSYSVNNKVIFPLSTFGPPTGHGAEFIVTDSTKAGTHLLKDINPGDNNGINGEGGVLGNRLIFAGNDGVNGFELWITDGSTANTQLLKDIRPGAGGSAPALFATLKDHLFFSADDGVSGRELWVTNGTAEGTKLVKDIKSGNDSSAPINIVPAGSKVFFTVFDINQGWQLWKTDGTSSGTVRIKDVDGNSNSIGRKPSNFTAVGSLVYFSSWDEQHGNEVWRSDGTEAGTYVIDVVDGINGSFPSLFTELNGDVYFKANDSFYKTNGSKEGTIKVSDLPPFEIDTLLQQIYFTAVHPQYGFELFHLFVKKKQSVVVHEIPAKRFGDPIFTISALASSGLTNFTYSSSNPAIAEITTDGKIKINGVGTTQITVTQPGNDEIESATATRALVVGKALQAITFSQIPNKKMGDEGFELSGTSSSGLLVSFKSNSELITIEGKIVSIKNPGTVSITALQEGSELYEAATSVTQTFCINPAKPSISTGEQAAEFLTLTSSSEAGNQWFIDGEIIDGALESTYNADETGLYSVQTTIDNCTSEMSDGVPVVITGIEDPISSLSLYPNPVSNTFVVDARNVQSGELVSVTIRDVLGRPHATFFGEDFIVCDVEHFDSGSYLVEIRTGKGIRCKLIFKQ
jgi:ELWxxDGT repeat protein